MKETRNKVPLNSYNSLPLLPSVRAPIHLKHDQEAQKDLAEKYESENHSPIDLQVLKQPTLSTYVQDESQAEGSQATFYKKKIRPVIDPSLTQEHSDKSQLHLQTRLSQQILTGQKSQQQRTMSENQLPSLVDNRLYFRYNDNNQNQNSLITSPFTNEKQNFPFETKPRSQAPINDQGRSTHNNLRKVLEKRSESQGKLALSLPMNQDQHTGAQEEESRLFQKFLKTFSTNNWSEFANQVIDNDKKQKKDVQDEQIHLNVKPKHYSRNNLLVSNEQPKTQNVSHFLKTFTSFKDHQWSKLNLDLNLSRAPKTLQRMAQFSNLKEEQQAQRQQQRQYSSNHIKNSDYPVFMTEESTHIEGAGKKTHLAPIQENTATQTGLSKVNNNFSEQKLASQQQQSRAQTSQLEHHTKFQRYKRDQEVTQMKTSLNQLNLLQSIGSVNILKEFKYPGTIEEIVRFIKEKDLDLYERIFQTRNLVKKRFQGESESHQCSKVQRKHKEKEFTRLFTKNERHQVVVLKDWLDYMIEQNVKNEDHLSTKRLQNEQLILCFTLCDLRDQLSTQCSERGNIIEKILALVFDMFKCYDSSYDNIVDGEVNQIKTHLKQQQLEQDQALRDKDRELTTALLKNEELQSTTDDKDNQIRALRAQNKTLEVRFTVVKNLIDNLMFVYKQKIEKEFSKSKEQRGLSRDFIYELRELKRFSTRVDVQSEDIDLSDEDRIKENMKRKAVKQTQTETLSQRLAIANKIGTAKTLKPRNQIVKSSKDKNIIGCIKADQELPNTESIEEEGLQVQEDDIIHDQQLNQQAPSSREQSKEPEEGHEQYDLTSCPSIPISEVNGKPNSSHFSQTSREGSPENHKKEDSLENNEAVQIQQEEMLQTINEFTPEELIEMINHYQLTSNNPKEDKELQTEFRAAPFKQHFSGKALRVPLKRKLTVQTFNVNEVPKKSSFFGNNQVEKGQVCVSPQISQGRGKIDKSSRFNINESISSSLQDSKDANVSHSPLRMNRKAFKNLKTSNSSAALLVNQSADVKQEQSPSNATQKNQKTTSNFQQKSSQQRGTSQGTPSLTADQIVGELSKLELSDLDNMLSTDRHYNKESMQVLSSLIGQLKKTQTFKTLVDKSAKEKLREEHVKDKAKQKRWNQKQAHISEVPSPQASVNNAEQELQMHQMRNETNEVSKEKNSKELKDSMVIEEYPSSDKETSPAIKKKQSKGTKGLSPKTNKHKKHKSTVEQKWKEQEKEKLKEKVSTEDKGVQVECQGEECLQAKQYLMEKKDSGNPLEEIKVPPEEFRDGSTSQRNQNSLPETNQDQISSARTAAKVNIDSKQRIRQMIKMVGKMSIAFQNPNENKAPRLSHTSSVGVPNTRTVFVPFNLGERNTNTRKLSSHPMARFLPTFLQKYQQDDKKFLNVYPMSLKSLQKYVLQFYTDKAVSSKDSLYARSQSLSEFMYDQLFNKYGIANITEKKMKEILLSVMVNKQKNVTIGMFAQFLCLESVDINFSNDDLSFFYRLNKLMVQSDSFQTIVRKEFNMESPKILFQNAYEVLVGFLSHKVSSQTLLKIQGDLTQSLKPHLQVVPPTNQILIVSEHFYQQLLNTYKCIKKQLFQYIKANLQVLSAEDEYPQSMQDKQLDQEQFTNLIQSLNTKGQLDNENPNQLFEANRIMVSSKVQNTNDDEKRISLESLISVIFKFNLIII